MSEDHGSETNSEATPRRASAEVVELREAGNLRSFPRARTALLVLGMHRSGTSAITRVLNLLGADLPKALMEPVAGDNPTGFWESRDIAALHDELLESAGSSWDDVSPLPASWFSSDIAGDYEDRLLRLLERDFADSSLFVVKDPRIARLVPLWQSVLQRFSADPRYVLIVRNPLEVAASLKARNDFLPAKSYLLWLWHLLEAETSTRRQPRAFLLFDELLRDWQGTARRLERQLQVSWPRRSATAGVEIDEFLSDRLRHHSARPEELEARGDTVGWVKRAYSTVLDAASGREGALAETLDSIRREAAAADIAFAPLVAQGRLQLARKETELQDLSATLDSQRGEHQRLSGALAERRAEIERLAGEIARRDGDLEAGRQEIERRGAALTQQQAEIERLADEIIRRDGELEAGRQEVERRGAALTQRQAEIERLADEIDRRETELAAKDGEIDRLGAAFASHDAQLQRLGSEIARRETELAGKDGEIDRLGTAYASHDAQLQRLRAEIARRETELAAKDGEIDRLGTAYASHDAELQRLGAEIARRETELAAKDGEVDRLGAAYASHDAQLQRLRAEIARRNAESASRQREMEALRRELTAREDRLAAQQSDLELLRASHQARQEVLRTIETEVQTQQTLLGLRRNEISRLRAELSASRADVTDLQGKRAELGAELDLQNRRVLDLEERLHSRDREVAARDGEIARLAGEVDSGGQENERLGQALAESANSAAALSGQLGRAEGEVAALEGSLSAARHSIRSLEERVAHGQSLVRGFRHSTSWRLTRPLRWLSETTRGFFGLGALAAWLAGALGPRTRRRRRRRRRFEASGAGALFDERYYRGQFANPDELGPDAVLHYLDRGFREGRDPHPLFDTAFYLEQNPETATGDAVPLTHYFESAAADGRDPHPLFDTAFYLQGLREPPAAAEPPLLHFLRVGAAAGRGPHPLFDATFYLDRNPDVAADGVNPLVHYLLFGAAEGRDPHPLFRVAHYLAQKPEITGSAASPLHHYLARGAAEGRDPHPLFSTSYYLAKNPDVAGSGQNPLAHFVSWGAAEGRDPHPFFDASHYLEQNPEVAQTGENPLWHYLHAGAASGRDPHPRFDTAFYQRNNPDAADAGMSPLEHFLAVGEPRGAWPCAIGPGQHEQTATDKLELFLSRPGARLVFPHYDEPLVSLVIPSFNRAQFLFLCLESVLRHADDVPFEVVVANDASRDATPQLLERLDNVKIVNNQRNLDFIRTVNKGAAAATGRYLLLLNNDITVAPQWLSTLVATIDSDPDRGAVGVKLVWPDGALQEAGSIIWQDGSALGYGRDEDPSKPEYSYLREADFCSAACLLVRADLFRGLGGLDELYLPAYYDDADLCFGIRQLGYKVIYQPRVTLTHHEFGTRSFAQASAQTQRNQPKFARKWEALLPLQARHGDVLRARDRRPGKRLLLIDDQVPAPYLGSGFPRAHRMLQMLAELGYVTTFVPSDNPAPHQPTTARLQQAGVEVFYGDGATPAHLLRTRPGFYDVIIVSRPHNGARFLALARASSPDARIVYDAEALFCVREFLQAEVEGRALSESARTRMLRDELEVMKDADTVITVSSAERERIVRAGGHPDIAVWGHALDPRAPSRSFRERQDILFVGGFAHGSPPNTDAVVHFVTALWPRIRAELPGCRFIVSGSQPGEEIQRLASPDVVVTGFVDDLSEYYERCRVFVVPLRFGAGISLKLLEAMSHGIPPVASSLAAVGLDLEDGREALIAGSDDEFVDKVVRLHGDEELWSAIQLASQGYIRQSYSSAAMKQRLAEILEP